MKTLLKRILLLPLILISIVFLVFVKVSIPASHHECIFIDQKFYQNVPDKTTLVKLPDKGQRIILDDCKRSHIRRADLTKGFARYLLVIK